MACILCLNTAKKNPQITTEREGWSCGFCGSCLRTGLDLAACLSAERIRYGLISLKTTSSHRLSTRLQTFFLFPLPLFVRSCLTCKLLVCTFHVFSPFLISIFGNYKERNGELSVMTCQVKAGMKFYSKTLLSFFPHTPCPPGPEFMGCLLF